MLMLLIEAVRLVDVHLDNEFELIVVGHGELAQNLGRDESYA